MEKVYVLSRLDETSMSWASKWISSVYKSKKEAIDTMIEYSFDYIANENIDDIEKYSLWKWYDHEYTTEEKKAIMEEIEEFIVRDNKIIYNMRDDEFSFNVSEHTVN